MACNVFGKTLAGISVHASALRDALPLLALAKD